MKPDVSSQAKVLTKETFLGVAVSKWRYNYLLGLNKNLWSVLPDKIWKKIAVPASLLWSATA